MSKWYTGQSNGAPGLLPKEGGALESAGALEGKTFEELGEVMHTRKPFQPVQEFERIQDLLMAEPEVSFRNASEAARDHVLGRLRAGDFSELQFAIAFNAVFSMRQADVEFGHAVSESLRVFHDVED